MIDNVQVYFLNLNNELVYIGIYKSLGWQRFTTKYAQWAISPRVMLKITFIILTQNMIAPLQTNPPSDNPWNPW